MVFFHSSNASKSTKLSNGKRVTFEVYKFFAGSWLGIAAVADQETIEGLDELVRKPKSGISRISQEDYESKLKKKALPTSLQPLRVLPSPLPPPQAPLELVEGRRVARLVAGGDGTGKVTEPVVAAAKVYDAVDDFLQIGVVKTLNIEPAPKSKGSGERSARSSGPPSRRPKYTSEPQPEGIQ